MKKLPSKTNSKTSSRYARSKHPLARTVKRLLPVVLSTSWLALFGSVSPAAEATYKLFGGDAGGYSSKDDLPGILTKEIGSRATIAEWDEIKKTYGQDETSLKEFCDKIGLAPNGSAWVTVGGKRIWKEERHYFIQRADHKLPGDFFVHEQLQNNLLLLGSWMDSRPVLVKIADFNAADAAKLAKWDKLLKAANEKDISGVYSLVSVDGKPVPASVNHDGAALQVRSGTFTINRDGTCASRMTFVPPSGSEANMDVKATFTREGRTLRMTWAGAGSTTGTVEGNTFTMNNVGMLLVYRK